MARIELKEMVFYAYHGCFEEEQIIGNKFIVDLIFECDTKISETTDRLTDTIDYQDVYNIVKTQMKQPSKLLEHVARRIITAVKSEWETIAHISVKISKCNPPVGGPMANVSVFLEA